MRVLAGLILALGLLGAPAGAAISKDSIALQPAGKWSVDYGDEQCALLRSYVAGDGTKYAFSLVLGPFRPGGSLALTTMSGSLKRELGDAYMRLDGVAAGTSTYLFFEEGEWRRRVFQVAPAALAKASRTLTFETQTEKTITLDMDGGPAALRALDECITDLYKSLGVDPALIARLATPPDGSSFRIFGPNLFADSIDYSTIYWVGVDGRVDDCRLIKPSGNTGFDKNFCAELKAKARFKAGIDKNGKPIRAPRFEHVQAIRRPNL